MRTSDLATVLLALLMLGFGAPACAQGQEIADSARLCTGGRAKNIEGRCICPSDKPIWTGIACERNGPPDCGGGRERNLSGYCLCPPARPRWNGEVCR